MILRVIIWIILIFIAVKIAGVLVRYVRMLMTPNRHIVDASTQPTERSTPIEDVPYEDVSDPKKE